jgi:peptide/nickel transport system substrate-binding protein
MNMLQGVLKIAVAGAALVAGLHAVWALELKETPTLAATHGELPPIAARVPADPLVVDLKAKGRQVGKHGGTINTLIGRSKDRRLINVWGYARLIGYTEKLELVPDILKHVDIEGSRIFTLHLRKGHKWSNGEPFTAEDFRYWWEDVATNDKLAPSGPPQFMRVNDKLPQFDVIDPQTVRYSWDAPNPNFLSTLAKSRPPFIYRPAHYLKQFHEKYGDKDKIAKAAKKSKVRNWAALHNRKDEMYSAKNINNPTLQPWTITKKGGNRRFIMVRNPYYHRVDTSGQQLPYVDQIIMTVADGGLIPAKTQAGEVELQARNLSFSDITILKQGETNGGYQTRLWPIAKGAQMAIFPNLTVKDPVWRKLMRDRRFRRALSLAIDRKAINNTLFYSLATPGNNTVLPVSPLYKAEYLTRWATLDLDRANALLDDIGLKKRPDGIRLLPDGRPLELIVETAGERQEQLDILELISETWRAIGVKLFPKPSDRDVLRKRLLTGQTQMAVWEGFDNGIPTPDMSPDEFAPVSVDVMWGVGFGAHYMSNGKSGDAVDYPPAKELLDLFEQWRDSTSTDERIKIWDRMLQIQSDETLSIGTVSGVRQPVVVSNRLHNVPVEGIYGWDPGAHYGIHRMDEFWLD